MRPLIWLLKLFTLDCAEERKTKKEKYCFVLRNILVAIFIGSLDVFCLYYKICYIYNKVSNSIKYTDMVQMIYDYFQYIIDLYFVNKYGRDMVLEYIKQYESIDKILDMVHHSEIQKRQKRLVIVFVCLWLITSAFEFTAWKVSYNWIVPIVHSIAYLFLFIKILTTMDLTTQIINVECRLKVMADIVQTIYNVVEAHQADDILTNTSCKDIFQDTVCNKKWFYSNSHSRVRKIQKRIGHLSPLSNNRNYEIKWLSRCYLMLTEQCSFINSMYGIRVLLNSLSLLIDMVRFGNLSAILLMKTQETPYDAGYFPIVSSLLRFLTCAAVQFSLVHHCEQTYREVERIVSVIDHMLIDKNPSEDLKAAVLEYRDLIYSRPISFNLANFFRLNYSYFISTLSVVVTYTIILLSTN